MHGTNIKMTRVFYSGMWVICRG